MKQKNMSAGLLFASSVVVDFPVTRPLYPTSNQAPGEQGPHHPHASSPAPGTTPGTQQGFIQCQVDD